MGGRQEVLEDCKIKINYFTNFILYTFVTYFIEQCVFDVSAILCQFRHALFQADSGVWGVFLPLRFSPHSWLFLVCYANFSKYVAETEIHYCLLSMPYCTFISFVAWRKAERTSFCDDLEVESSRSKRKRQEFLLVLITFIFLALLLILLTY